MAIIRLLSFAGLFVVFLSSAAAIPVQMRETSGLNEAVYTEPELMEALARSYGAVELPNRNERSVIKNIQERNLDHIGGGNLLRRALAIPQQNRKPGIVLYEMIFTRGPNGGIGPSATIRDSRIIRRSRQGIEPTFDANRRFNPQRNQILNLNGLEFYHDDVKRNMDEIDRTGFDSFSKRNFDEIDRTGWDNFMKRHSLNGYLASRQP